MTPPTPTGGLSEIAIGKALSAYPRESFYLADKFPGHQIASSYDPAAVFEDQLKKCGVDYFDFYLLHNVNEHSIRILELQAEGGKRLKTEDFLRGNSIENGMKFETEVL